ncbi:GRB10-interacting GYF protein 2 isoform X1 [Bufo gargarizans]|uniref:GRB10-interacting GYF protein 2 isoform X1 n=1 Tax=Bufo gargarizans TaxID=30331 RepID=UPI001CF56FEB|nr:GRB10-interacting GYF protein 2 isoform X1 [Bufo gargarizans]XP_044147963.1 GRB10-interacting GYF protein 2 isoform X1 [Bufo gargarizans]XP_044147964.1 GRB10-interacting GYF protein 2 isoform X1 [Bufo gargarizans]
MTAETQTLTFGPEWLRALSSGGSVISPPLSPALPKYKLADYRYGREEMLALYIKDNKVPSDLLDKEFLPILKEEPLLPLALVPFTEEEQRNFSMSVNSAAVLRLMGRGTGGGGGTVVGAPRGRSSSRGRGRGRGESGFYQRSFDEVESGFGRGAREMHRSQSWEERGDRRFEKPARKEPVRPPFEEGIAAPAGRKHEFVRSETGSWRSLREELNGEEEEGGGVWRTAAPRRDGERWRAHSPDGARGPGWREHPDRRRRFDFDFRERDDERGHRRTRSGSGSAEDERDCLPEWCLEDAEDETGTFDSSGAFLPSKKVQKESIPEEQELDFRPSLDGEEHSDSDGSNFEDAKEKEVVQVPEQSSETSKNDSFGEGQVTNPSEMEHRTPSPAKKTETKADSPVQNTTPPMASSIGQEAKLHTNLSAPAPPTHKEESVSPGSRGSLESTAPSISHSPSAFSQSSGPQQVKDPQQGPAVHSPLIKSEISSGPSPPSVCAAPGMGTLVSEPDEDDGLEHLEQQAQQMVAYLQDGALDDERLTGKAPDHRVKGHSPENQQKWYYKDPQGEIQGPFSNREMAEWYQAGYFPITLLLRRVCDETFQPLGDIIKLWGRVPFITPPAPRLGELGPEHIGRHQEMTALYQLQQLHYQQFLIQQQYTQVMAQQQKAALSSQQQQQLALLLQQFQTLKMRISEQPVVPPLPRAMSVPDNTSLWELQTAAPPPSLWEGSSVWDLPIESVSQGATREQLEKAKAAKIEQERREAELRAKQEEEEQRRRLEEEERKRKEELELARRKQEEALRRQREQELALRRQIEEEERKREDERRLLEERRRQEEERRRQEEEKRRLEEERKRLEEERKRKEEEKKREEEEKRKREELRKQEEAAKWAREEEEAARRLMEETRLRQEEEELKKREEAQRQKELQRQRQQQQEALRRLQQLQQQQQLAQMKLPSSSTWGQQVNSGGASQSTLSLAEIQKLEEERERQNQEEQRRQHQELRSVQQQQQQQQQQQKTPGWGNVVKPTVNTKSLVEIQQEEARQMQKMHQQAGRGRPANVTLPPAPTPVPNPVNSVSSSGSSVWGNLNNNMSPQWSPDSVSSIWSSPEIKTSTGFWDDAVKVVAPRNAVNKNKSNSSKSSGVNSRQSKKVEQEEKLVRLFQGAAKCADGFNQWCEQTLHALSTAHSLDVPTFVSFLREVESAYEVHDYVRAYLGDTPEAKDFSKQFLERRNKQKTVPQKPQQDSAWPVFQTSPNNLQQTTLETAQSAGRKKKKQKMVRADPSLLGFSVNASSERLNMGEIETLEDY